jgi:hypothetical protein
MISNENQPRRSSDHPPCTSLPFGYIVESSPFDSFQVFGLFFDIFLERWGGEVGGCEESRVIVHCYEECGCWVWHREAVQASMAVCQLSARTNWNLRLIL